jgi:hypothetical protein
MFHTDIIIGTSCLTFFVFFFSPSGSMEYCFKSGHDRFRPHQVTLIVLSFDVTVV